MATKTARLLVKLALLSLASVASPVAQLPSPTGSRMVHLNPSAIDRLSACATVVGRQPLLYSVDARWPATTDACPQNNTDFERLIAKLSLTVVKAGGWDFVYPTWWSTQPILSAPTWNRLAVSEAIKEWSFEGRRKLSESELHSIVESVRAVARPPMIADHPLGREDGKARDRITLQVVVDVPELKKGTESIVAVYGEPRGLGRVVYGEIERGRFVPHWDSALMTTDVAFRLDYQDLDGDGVLEVVATGREGRDGWTFTAFDSRGREITRQTVCEPGSWYLGPGDPAVEGGSTCAIHGHVDGRIEFDRQANGRTELVGSVWYATGNGPKLGPVRFKLIDGQYVRDPKYPAVKR